MISKEMGPMEIFARLRAYLGARQFKPGGMYDMVSCVACSSVWIGAVAALGAAHGLFSWIVYTLAFSAIATILEKVYVKTK